MIGNYKIITLCGSTRFKDDFMRVQKELTLKGNIVISVGLFGKIGFGLGIATIAMCLLPIFSIISLETGVAGIVFSCLGKKDPSLAKKTKLGFVLSLVGTIVGFIMFIVWEVVLGLGMAEMYY